VAKLSKQQIASVRSALQETGAELLAWDPHILISFEGEAQKAQVIARMSQLDWHYINDPSNETSDVSLLEFSLDKAPPAAHPSGGKVRRTKFPPSFFASFGVLFALVGVLLAVISFYTDYRMGHLNNFGKLAAGEIERTYSRLGRGGRTYYASYRFVDTHGISHENEDTYPFNDWNTLRRGDPISITYLPDEPERNSPTQRVKLVIDRSIQDKTILIGTPWVLSGWFFFGYWARKRSLIAPKKPTDA
jgi:hypothetical protein